MAQSKQRSWAEAFINIAIGYFLNFVLNLVVFRSFGYNISVRDNIMIGLIFTVVSVIRQYVIRRWFNRKE